MAVSDKNKSGSEYLRRELPDTHEKYMQRCLALAQRGQGQVMPNPMVGCVIVYENKIISEGGHVKYGENHAERNAILPLLNDPGLPKSTLYVNLEPCAHYGKTPPCADFIIESGIRKVVIGSPDPFAQVNGRGFEKLKAAGIEVIENICRKECDEINRRFFTFHNKKRPYIILKWAETADGFMAPTSHKKFQISGEMAQKTLHKWRSEEAGILVGAGTVKWDKPRLDVRLWQGNTPRRFVLDGALSNDYPYDDLPISVFNFEKNAVENKVVYCKIMREKPLASMLEILYQQGIQSLLVEGGAITLSHFLDENIWDEIRIIKSKTVQLKEGITAPIINFELMDTIDLDTDKILIIRREKP